jgi:hypothetical protein
MFQNMTINLFLFVIVNHKKLIKYFVQTILKISLKAKSINANKYSSKQTKQNDNVHDIRIQTEDLMHSILHVIPLCHHGEVFSDING